MVLNKQNQIITNDVSYLNIGIIEIVDQSMNLFNL